MSYGVTKKSESPDYRPASQMELVLLCLQSFGRPAKPKKVWEKISGFVRYDACHSMLATAARQGLASLVDPAMYEISDRGKEALARCRMARDIASCTSEKSSR